jgi:glutathione S-transferase
MKLRYSGASPFVRKVMVVAHEHGLADRIERLPADPWDPKTDLISQNPLSKVPALILDDGMVLFDSPVICEYVDAQGGGPTLYPPPGPARWRALRQQALADGILDAGITTRRERMRPDGERSAGAIDRQMNVLKRGLATLENWAGEIEGPLTIGQVTVGCCLGWIDFRDMAPGWRDGAPKLARWFEGFGKRPSMAATMPVA